jgi:hypothetical protein
MAAFIDQVLTVFVMLLTHEGSDTIRALSVGVVSTLVSQRNKTNPSQGPTVAKQAISAILVALN